MEYLSRWTGYRFDDLDWQAVATCLPETDPDSPDGGCDYPLDGQPPLKVWLAINHGASPVSRRVVGDMDVVLRSRVETPLELLADLRNP